MNGANSIVIDANKRCSGHAQAGKNEIIYNNKSTVYFKSR